MSRSIDAILALALMAPSALTAEAADHGTGYFDIGKPATAAEIAGWDIDIRPDGEDLPLGHGSVADGEALFEARCAGCHGYFGEGVGAWPALAGGAGTLATPRPEKTVGSFWPYATTLWDYIHRAMPFTSPQSLSANETYALTAYVLYLNGIVPKDFVVGHANLAAIAMPNRNGFYRDDRPDVYGEACMRDCKPIGTDAPTDAPAAAAPANSL